MAWVSRRAIIIVILCFGAGMLPISSEAKTYIFNLPFFWGMIALGRVFYELLKTKTFQIKSVTNVRASGRSTVVTGGISGGVNKFMQEKDDSG